MTDTPTTPTVALEAAAKVAALVARKAANEVHSYDCYGGLTLPGREREAIRQEVAEEIEKLIRAIPVTSPPVVEDGRRDVEREGALSKALCLLDTFAGEGCGWRFRRGDCAGVVSNGRSPSIPRQFEAATCDLCAGKCRGHSLGRPEEWQPEPGSRALSTPSADAVGMREALEGLLPWVQGGNANADEAISAARAALSTTPHDTAHPHPVARMDALGVTQPPVLEREIMRPGGRPTFVPVTAQPVSPMPERGEVDTERAVLIDQLRCSAKDVLRGDWPKQTARRLTKAADYLAALAHPTSADQVETSSGEGGA